MYGIKAFTGDPNVNALEASFKPEISWASVQRTYLRCGLAPLVVIGPSSGKLAKYEFTLPENSVVTSVAWSPDGRYIAETGSETDEIHVWDAKRRAIVKVVTHQFPTDGPQGLSWSVDGRYLADCNLRHVRLYAANTWRLVHTFPDLGCYRAVFSSDGRQIAVVADAVLPAKLSVYAMGTWKLIKSVDLRDGWARSLVLKAIAYVPGTHTLLLGGYDFEGVAGKYKTETGRLWVLPETDLTPNRSIHAYFPDSVGRLCGDVLSLAVSPDGRRVATGTETGNGSAANMITQSVHVFDLNSGALIGAMPAGVFQGKQSAMAFTHDGRYLISLNVTRDGSHAVYLIDAKTLQLVDTFDTGNIVYDLTVRQDGKAFAVGSGNSIIVWSFHRKGLGPPPMR